MLTNNTSLTAKGHDNLLRVGEFDQGSNRPSIRSLLHIVMRGQQMERLLSEFPNTVRSLAMLMTKECLNSLLDSKSPNSRSRVSFTIPEAGPHVGLGDDGRRDDSEDI